MTKSDLVLRQPNGAPLRTAEMDSNWNRLMYWNGIWSPGTSEPNEVVWHQGAVWSCIATTTDEPGMGSANWVLVTPSTGRGGMTIDAAKQTLSSIGTAYTRIDQFDSIDVPAAGITLNLATGEFSFQWPGIWEMTISIVLDHNESNQGRKFNVRLYNVTDGTPGVGLPWSIGRNTPGTNIIIPFPVIIDPTNVDKQYHVEVGDATQTITVSQMDGQAFDFFQKGPSIT